MQSNVDRVVRPNALLNCRLERFLDHLDTYNINQTNLSLTKVLNMNMFEAMVTLKSLPNRCVFVKSMLNSPKTQIVYNLLERNQPILFEQLHQSISLSYCNSNSVKKPTTICIDSGPNTGKSFLVSSLVATIQSPCQKFMLANACEDYDKTGLFCDEGNLEDMLKKIYFIIHRFPRKSDLLVLEEYNSVSPWFILVLTVAAKVKKFNLVCTGDKNQLKFEHYSEFHRDSEYAVIEHLFDQKLNLTTEPELCTVYKYIYHMYHSRDSSRITSFGCSRHCKKKEFRQKMYSLHPTAIGHSTLGTNVVKSVSQLISVGKFLIAEKKFLFADKLIEGAELISMYLNFIVRNRLQIEVPDNNKVYFRIF